MRIPKKALSIFICVVIVLSFSMTSFATEGNIVNITDKDLGISSKNTVQATPGISSGSEPNTPGGVLVPSISHNVSPMLTFPPQYICTITSTYDGGLDRGDVASGTNKKPVGSGNDTLSVAFAHTVSNTISVNAKFPINRVEATVGYSGSWSDSRTFTYVAVVPPQTTVYVGYQDLYHVQYYDWKIEIPNLVSGGWMTTDSGTGWAQQWYSYHFYSHILYK